MRVHLMRPGRDQAIAYAIDVLLRVRFSLDVVADDAAPDFKGPSRQAYLQSVQGDVTSAIAELKRAAAAAA